MKALILTVALVLSTQISFAKEPTQEIQLKVTATGFEPSEIKVKPGTHLVLKVTRTTDETCATQIKVTEKKIKKELPLNKEVVIDLGTLKKGDVKFACGMDMISGHIVIE
jgi:plastocyanin domain-containing protein